MILALLRAALADPCPEPVDEIALLSRLHLAEASFGDADVPAFTAAVQAVVDDLPCVDARLSTSTIGRLHRDRGLLAFLGDDIANARLSFASARITSEQRFDEEILPADHPVWPHFDALDVEEIPWFRVSAPVLGTEVAVDGLPDGRFKPGLPHVFQVLGKDVRTYLVAPGEPFPEYARQTPKQETPPEAPKKSLAPALAIGTGAAGLALWGYGHLRFRQLKNTEVTTEAEQADVLRRIARNARRGNVGGVGLMATSGLITLAWAL
jgi:hypothetical protein